MRLKKSKEKSLRLQEPLYLSLVICLPQVTSKPYFQRGTFRFLIMFGSLEIPIETGIPFNFGNFRTNPIQFKKIRFGDFKSSPQ